MLVPDRASDDPHMAAIVAVAARVTGALAVGSETISEKALLGALYDRQRSGSLRYDLSALRRAARAVRERFSSDTWRVLNDLDTESTNAAELRRAPAEVDRLLLLLAGFSGLGAESMHRGQGWRFLEIGRRLERALMTLLMLRAACGVKVVPWEDLLAIADVSADYRRRNRGAAPLVLLVDLFVGDETNPRSIVYQLRRLEQLLNGLSPQIVPPQRSAEEELLQATLEDIGPSVTPGATLDADLDATLAKVQKNLTAISDQLTRSYFGRPDRLQQLVTIKR
jgi:uncharacterized alpha-E superfamily protein